MEKMKQILYQLKTDVNAEKISFATKDGLVVVQVPDPKTEDSKSAIGATILGAAELLLAKPLVMLGGAHEKIVIASAGSMYYLLVELRCEGNISEDIQNRIVGTAGKISSVINK